MRRGLNAPSPRTPPPPRCLHLKTPFEINASYGHDAHDLAGARRVSCIDNNLLTTAIRHWSHVDQTKSVQYYHGNQGRLHALNSATPLTHFMISLHPTNCLVISGKIIPCILALSLSSRTPLCRHNMIWQLANNCWQQNNDWWASRNANSVLYLHCSSFYSFMNLHILPNLCIW